MLDGLKPKHIIAAGESQSAGRLVTYIDALHPLVHVYDGFLVHSRSAGGSPLSQAPQPSVPVPAPAPIRDDLGVPVLVFQTETDVSNSNLNARQPDTDTYRLVGGRGNGAFRLLRAQHRAERHRRWSGRRRRCSRRCRTPRTGRARASPAIRRSTPGRRTTPSMRPSSRAQAVGHQGRRATDRASHSRPRAWVPSSSPPMPMATCWAASARPPWMHPSPHSAVGGQGGNLVLLPLRHDGAVDTRQLAVLYPSARQVRVRMDPSDEVGASRRGSSSPRTPRQLDSRGGSVRHREPVAVAPSAAARAAGRRGRGS